MNSFYSNSLCIYLSHKRYFPEQLMQSNRRESKAKFKILSTFRCFVIVLSLSISLCISVYTRSTMRSLYILICLTLAMFVYSLFFFFFTYPIISIESEIQSSMCAVYLVFSLISFNFLLSLVCNMYYIRNKHTTTIATEVF